MARRKRLELIWPNKDKLFLGLDENGQPIWGTKDDIESRIFWQLEAIGEVNPDNPNNLYEQGDNLLIKGDNLLALKSLEKHFAGKIKCIYIDPPFNTGNAYEHYDDGYEHTIWLSMMKARLEILKKLLREDGMIFVNIDDNEQAYLKVLMDEIFGRTNYRTTITVKMSEKSGVKMTHVGKTLPNMVQFILFYAGHGTNINPLVIEKDEKTLEHYLKYYTKMIENPEDPPEQWRIVDIKEYMNRVGSKQDEIDFKITHAKQIIYRTNSRYLSKLPKHTGIKLVVSPTGKKYISWENKEMLFLYDYLTESLGNLWLDISTINMNKEGGANFPQNKKPESLIERIIQLSTSPGDWVLDSFLGSGTTAAVAHKMGRKWIGIEIGDHAETLCLPRLKRVVSGEDQTGISKAVGWKGGGGFRYLVLDESLYDIDKDTGLVMINPRYYNGPLVRAICNLEDFNLNNDHLFQGVRGNTYAHIAEEKLTQAYLEALLEKLPEDKNLVIYCFKRTTKLALPENVRIKRIPKDLRIPPYLKGGK